MSETYRVLVEPVGRQVDCRADQTVLDACLRAGVWVPHSCTHGTCGTCKAEVVDGEVDHGASSTFALMDFERDDGKTLLCCATPRSDLVIEADADADDDLAVHPVEDYVGRVVSIDDVARDTRRVVIEADRDVAFNAGQYVAWQLPGGSTRTYSLANPPSQRRLLEFHIRRVAGGACSDGWVFSHLAVADRVALAGPYGRFTLRPARDEPAVLVAGGTGLAPITSMIRHALLDGVGAAPMTLYCGGRTREWLYHVEDLRELAAAHPRRFTYVPCLSEEDAPGFRSGLVTDVLAADHERLAGHVAYVCGPPGMVDAALRVLMARRLFPRDIYREEFLDERDRATGGLRSPLIKR